MRILSADFIISAANPTQFPGRPIPHVVFAGRSNVGKSSLLNALVQRKGLAQTSKTPGKTRMVNFFLINDRMFFVDLPGYGFAKVSKKEKKHWDRLINAYFFENPLIAAVYQLIDIRHDVKPTDLQLADWLSHERRPFQVVLTKADKLSRNQVRKQHLELAFQLEMDASSVIPTSSSSGLGLDQVWRSIETRIQQAREQQAIDRSVQP